MMLFCREKATWLCFTALVAGLLFWESQNAVVASPNVGDPADRHLLNLQPEEKPKEKGKDKEKKDSDKKDDKKESDDEWEDYVPEEEQTDDQSAPKIRRLKKEEISKIRFLEMNAMRGVNRVESIAVNISRDLANDFLLEMTGHEDFRQESTRREFMKLTPPQKVHYIAKYTGAKFVDRIEIKSDPAIFKEFNRNVLPYVVRGCATGGCHNAASKTASGFRLFKDAKRSPATTYANFIVLNDFANEAGALINRNSPQNSLLAHYLIEPDQVTVENRHPGDAKYRPPFRNRNDKRYQRILDWMARLKIPAEDYGVRLIPKFQPNETPFDDEVDPDDTKEPGENDKPAPDQKG